MSSQRKKRTSIQIDEIYFDLRQIFTLCSTLIATQSEFESEPLFSNGLINWGLAISTLLVPSKTIVVILVINFALPILIASVISARNQPFRIISWPSGELK